MKVEMRKPVFDNHSPFVAALRTEKTKKNFDFFCKSEKFVQIYIVIYFSSHIAMWVC
jgi:hypothetical protein